MGYGNLEVTDDLDKSCLGGTMEKSIWEDWDPKKREAEKQ